MLKFSPTRKKVPDQHQLTGTGFLTFDDRYGAVVHTSKHVVMDPLEARHTVVRLFYDQDDAIVTINGVKNLKNIILGRKQEICAYRDQNLPRHGLFVTRGMTTIKSLFRSVRGHDYTAFSCQLPIHELFSLQEQLMADRIFSWQNFKLNKSKKDVLRKSVDVAVISHPHGLSKKIGFGRYVVLFLHS